jgi:hypothetical protein
MKPDLYIRFSIRDEDGGRSGGVLVLPLQGAWQEDPNDLHVAFAYEGAEKGVWYRPAVDKKTGDYLLPAPDSVDAEQIVRRKSPQTGAMTKCVLAYSIDWLGKLPAIYGKAWLESPAYIKQVEGFWYSPNI